MPTTALTTAVAQALAACFPPELGLSSEDVARLLAPPPKADMGDLAFPCFQFAKTLRRAPQQIAAELAETVAAGKPPLLAEVTALGPYLNLRLDLGIAAAMVLPGWARGEAPTFDIASQRIMVEFSQPNTHKAFHVGHMRNLCLGDALVRILRAVGHDVVSANYMGDVGTHIAKCLWGYIELLTEAEREPPETGKGEWLGELYARASIQLDEWQQAGKAGDEGALGQYEAARTRMTEILRKVEARDPELTALWNKTRQWSLDEFDEIYQWCGVEFDRVFFESEVDAPGLELVEEYLAKGVFETSQGAVGITNDEIKHMPFFMLRKRDGTSLYSTKDLALARIKFDEFDVDRSIYVVDTRQSDHFKHVFLTLKKMGFAQADRCEHVPYEMVELPEGAMAARDGNVVLLRRLREQMTSRLVSERFDRYEGDWPPEEIAETSRQVALAAIRFGMLDRDVNQKIVFDMANWLEFEGRTGPYLQYVTARIASILEKAGERELVLDPAVLEDGERQRLATAALEHAAERNLVNELAALPGVVAQVADNLRPSVLCTQLFTLAKAYNSFQSSCDVIHSTGDLLQGRLLLVKSTREALAWGLSLLGIAAPRRM
jgi:arginyl-tRNA synthetase